MGAWATDSFSNDDAVDWLLDFVEAPTIEMLRDTLEHVANESDEMPEAPDCSEAIAAAEIVAALSGKPAAKLPDDLRAWLSGGDRGLKTEALKGVARAALERIIDDSELQELWAESDLNSQWLAEMADLDRRLL